MNNYYLKQKPESWIKLEKRIKSVLGVVSKWSLQVGRLRFWRVIWTRVYRAASGMGLTDKTEGDCHIGEIPQPSSHASTRTDVENRTHTSPNLLLQYNFHIEGKGVREGGPDGGVVSHSISQVARRLLQIKWQ
ncbi:hypothetical protein J6590_080892 [Homalodisca vitripennis]|nr:hypothetical protein J6590_080892 [Homalodisca vitripennis]